MFSAITTIVSSIGLWWGHFLTSHPFGTGLWIMGFFLGWVFQHTVKLRYPDYATRPEWARWFVFFSEALKMDLVNVVLRRWPKPVQDSDVSAATILIAKNDAKDAKDVILAAKNDATGSPKS